MMVKEESLGITEEKNVTESKLRRVKFCNFASVVLRRGPRVL